MLVRSETVRKRPAPERLVVRLRVNPELAELPAGLAKFAPRVHAERQRLPVGVALRRLATRF
jgi:hypothetical protein